MNTILKLRQKRKQVWESAKTFLEAKRDDNGMVSQEDTAVYEKMEQEVVDLGKEIDRLERQEAMDKAFQETIATAEKTEPMSQKMKQGRASEDYKRDFWNLMRDPKAPITNALQVGTDSEGGYLAPDEFERTLVESLEEENIFRQLAHVIRTSSGDRKIPVAVGKGEAAWIDEEQQFPESDPSFGQITIGSHKLGTMIKVSEELLQDSVFDLEGYIAKEFGRRLGAKEEEAFFVGDGTGKPMGIFDKTNGGEIGITTQVNNQITADDIIDLYYSLKSPYRKNAVFVMNDATVKEIRKLKDTTGQYLWQPSLTAGTPDTILNLPVYTSSFIPQIKAGTTPIAFGDFSYYWIADRQGRSFKRLDELFSATGQVGFRAQQRVDGRLVLKEAMKLLKMKAS